MQTVRRPLFAGLQNVETTTAHRSGRGSIYESVPKWSSGYASRRKLNVTLQLIMAYFFFRLVDDTGFCEIISQIAVCDLRVIFLPPPFACTQNGVRSRRINDSKICSRGDGASSRFRVP